MGKQFFTVELHGSGPYSYFEGGHQVLDGDPPKELHGRYHKWGVRGSWRRQISQEVDLEGKVEDIILLLQERSQGLEGAYLTIEMKSEPYSDSEYPKPTITANREATPEEVEWIKTQGERDARAEEQQRQERIQQLKRQLEKLEA